MEKYIGVDYYYRGEKFSSTITLEKRFCLKEGSAYKLIKDGEIEVVERKKGLTPEQEKIFAPILF